MIYLFCVLVPIVFINLILLGKISILVKGREEENLQISLNRAQSDLVGIIENCIAVSHSVSSDRSLYEILDRQYAEIRDYYDVYYSQLRDRLNRYEPIYNHISELSIYTTNNTIASGGSYLCIDDQVRSKKWYQAVMNSDTKIALCAYRETILGKAVITDQSLSLVRKMDESESLNNFEHLISIKININKVFEIFNREENYLHICLVDNENNIIYAPENQLFQRYTQKYPNYDEANLGKNNLIFDQELGEARYLNGWRIVGITDKRVIMRTLNQSRFFVLFLALVSTLISTALIFIIVRSFNYRINRLSKHMKKVENQQLETIEINEGQDEIGDLIKKFNLMTTKINSLINDVYKLNIQKKDLELERVRAELNFLQSQMNPHFLFNTLNAILVVCVKNNYTEIIEVIRYLSKTLRRLFTWKDDLVTIEEELTFSEMYLKIEKFRFKNKFLYEIIVDQESLGCKIPKMTIQPLIENACKHGIQTNKGIGLVKVHIKLTAGTLSKP